MRDVGSIADGLVHRIAQRQDSRDYSITIEGRGPARRARQLATALRRALVREGHRVGRSSFTSGVRDDLAEPVDNPFPGPKAAVSA